MRHADLLRRLTRLEQRAGPAQGDHQQAASRFDDDFGRWMLEAQPPERRKELLQGGQLTIFDFQLAGEHPKIKEMVEDKLEAWKRARGFPSDSERETLIYTAPRGPQKADGSR
jgi:hypothetical protein